MEAKNYTYLNGDKAEYIGTTQMLYGGLFYDLVIVEGHNKGKQVVSQTPPNGESPFVKRNQEQWKKEQAGFSKLKNLKV
jgi:hypothetical protein